MKKIMLVMLIASGIFSCENSKKTSSTMSPASLSGNWQAISLRSDKSFTQLYPGKIPTMSFDVSNLRVSGNTGCNRYTGPYKASGNQLSFQEPITMTKMMCITGAEGEQAFVAAMTRTSSYGIAADTLLLKDSSGQEIMKLVKQP